MEIKNYHFYFRLFIVIIIILLIVAGCATANKSSIYNFYKEELKTVNKSDGISKKEAIIIARNYLIRNNISKRVNIHNPKVSNSRLVNNSWCVIFDTTFVTKFQQGLVYYEIDIDKTSGEIKGIGWWPDL
jgi:hypothetical protein